MSAKRTGIILIIIGAIAAIASYNLHKPIVREELTNHSWITMIAAGALSVLFGILCLVRSTAEENERKGAALAAGSILARSFTIFTTASAAFLLITICILCTFPSTQLGKYLEQTWTDWLSVLCAGCVVSYIAAMTCPENTYREDGREEQ